MDEAARRRVQLDCLYEMFRDRIEENVVYIVYSENEGRIDTSIDQLMSIAACSFTGHYFENKCRMDGSLKKYDSRENSENATSTANLSRLTPSPLNSDARSRARAGDEYPDKDDHGVNDDAEDETKLSLDEQIERVQKCIEDLLMEKRNSHDKASQYLSKRMFPVTSYYSDVAGQLRSMIDKKTKHLVDLLLRKSENANSIDLHGLNPIQARLVVSELLNIRQNKLMIDKQGEASVDIITGWGKHCVTNGQRIRPTIVALLKEKGFEFIYVNKGALRVTIRRC